MKSNLGNYTHQVANPNNFLRFDLTEGDCWFKEKVIDWFKEMSIEDVIHYPDERIVKTKKLLARWLHVRPENITLGNGSDELIEIIPKIFLSQKDEVLISTPTFFRFQEASIRAGAKVKPVRLKEENGFQWDNDVCNLFLKKALNNKVKLIWLASPNNPTGIDIPKQVLLKIISLGKVVVLDKVLNGFTKELREASQLIWKNPNLIVLSSFSKTFGLPGLRFGFAIANQRIIKLIEKWRLPFNVSGPTLFIVKKLLEPLISGRLKVEESSVLFKERRLFEEKIKGLRSIKLSSQSKTNFILLKSGNIDLFSQLLKRKILVTNLNQSKGIKNKNFIKVTLRDRKTNLKLFKALKEINNHFIN